MSEREELEAEIKAIEEAWLFSDDTGDMAGRRGHLATALLSSGYTKTDDLPWRISDIKRGLILFRTSNNAHGHTNHSTLSDRVDGLPDVAKQELAGMMINMATGLDPSVMDRFGYTKGNGERTGDLSAIEDAYRELAQVITGDSLGSPWGRHESDILPAACALKFTKGNGELVEAAGAVLCEWDNLNTGDIDCTGVGGLPDPDSPAMARLRKALSNSEAATRS